MDAADDLLRSMEEQASKASGAGETPPVPVTDKPVSEVSGYSLVEQSLPDADHKLLARWVQRYRLDDDDPIFGQYLTARVAFSAAVAAGDAAQAAKAAVIEVQEGIGKIQGQILAGAMKAGTSIQKDMTHVIAKGGDALLASIAEAAAVGAKKVEAGSKDLISKLDAAVEVKKAEGVSAFAAAASEAAVAASTAAARQVISETKVKLRRSAIGMSLIFLIYAVIGGGVAVEYLSLTHRIAPHALVMTAGGKPNCGNITINGGVQTVCQIR